MIKRLSGYRGKSVLPDQRIIRGTLETIADIVAKEGRIAPSYDRSKPCIR